MARLVRADRRFLLEDNDALVRMGTAIHPVVMRHPVTARAHLFVNPSFTYQIVGMSRTDSERLLQYLYDHMQRPEYQMRLRWRENMLVLWDNRVTQHYACADYLPEPRRMHRVTVVDDRWVDQGAETPTARLTG